MFKLSAYHDTSCNRRVRVLFFRCFFVFSLLVSGYFSPGLMAQDDTGYDEILVAINVKGVGTGDFPGIISEGEIFLPVKEIFDFIQIKCSFSAGMDSISGFFITEDNNYLIDKSRDLVILGKKEYQLDQGDLLRTETDLFLKSRYFGEIFGLRSTFYFRSLSVLIESDMELPVIRAMKQEEIRKNISRIKGNIITDTTIKRTYPAFHFGMADWSVVATQESDGTKDARFNLGIGTVVGGGELNALLYYNTAEPFNEKLQYYRWRFVDNDRTAWKQIIAGKLNTYATSSVYDPVIGAQITNTPTTFRKSFGSYTISDRTEPGWIVELYLNNVLVDYVKADASGFYSFDVPLVYGVSNVKLRFYGPWGEERTQEQTLNIPYVFVPEKKLEYTASAGMVEDTLGSVFTRASMGYGLSNRVTIGGGVEFLSSLSKNPVMPYINTSVRLASSMMLSAEYTYGVRAKASFSYRLPSNIQLDANYIIYQKGQTAINYNYRQERKIVLTAPFKAGSFTSFNRFSVNQYVLPTTNYTSAEWMFSTPVFGLNANMTTYALFVGDKDPNIYSNLALAIKLPARFTLIPQTQYSYTDNGFMSAKLRLEKVVMSNGFLNLSYEQNFRNNLKIAELGFRYDFSFAQTGASVRHSNDLTSVVEYAKGSIIYDRRSGIFSARKYMSVGKGGITVQTYLDRNGNGTRDKGEQLVVGMNLHSSAGRVEVNDKDSTLVIYGLEPYSTCYLELDANSLDNIAWSLKSSTIAVEVDPNMIKSIEVPITVMGEASGMVYLSEDGAERGLSRIIVNFFTTGNRSAGRTLSEMDGYYSYLGFIPGTYTAMVDTAQLRRLKMKASPASRTFTIREDSYGDIVDGLDFTLSRIIPDTALTVPVIAGDTVKAVAADTTGKVTRVVRQDTTVMVIHEVTREVITTEEGKFAIQVGAFKRKSNAEALKKKLATEIDKNVEIISEGGFYKVRVTGFESREELDKYIPVLKKYGITEMWIVNTVVKKQDVVITTQQDTVRKVVTITETEQIPRTPPGELGIQVGAYREKRWANLMRNRTKNLTDKNVTISYEDGFYKVRITGIGSVDEMEDMMPVLFANGYKDIWILPYNEKIEMPYKPETIRQMIKLELAPVANAVPTVALQVGAFMNKRDAAKAARKISKGTGRMTEVAKQWDYFTVFVTGFYTREETYKYYPEIVLIGYPDIYLVEHYTGKQKKQQMPAR